MEKILYQFDDSMFPKKELIIEVVNDAGFELNENYTGSSSNPVLVSIFTELVKQNKLDVLETQFVEVDGKVTYPMEKAILQRYGMNDKQGRVFERLVRMSALADTGFALNKYSFDDLNYIAAMILLHDSVSSQGYWFSWDVSVIYKGIQNEWWERYGLKTLAPFSFVENYFRIDSKVKALGMDKKYSQSKGLMAGSVLDIGLLAAVRVAFLFDADTVENLVKNELTAETIMGYIDSGIGSSQEILEWSENMPAEWFTALIGAK